MVVFLALEIGYRCLSTERLDDGRCGAVLHRYRDRETLSFHLWNGDEREGNARMAKQAEVGVRIADGVHWVTIQRAAVRNAINDGVLQGISRALAEAVESEALCIVLTGEGEAAFCAGGDLKPNSGTFEFDFSKNTTAYSRLLRQAMACEVPMIARVNGACLAGGMGLMAMCDMAVAASDVSFGLPEVKIGLFPMQVASVLQGQLPRRAFMELCLTGEPITATEAHRLGMINYVVEREELDQKVDWLVARITGKSPVANRRGKHALAAIRDMTFEQSIAYTEGQIGPLRLTKDAQEGISAFNERRRPVFRRR